MDTAQWAQEIVVKPIEEIVTNTCTPKQQPTSSSTALERKTRPQKEQALNCPRCNSANTKFCYYNNYSLTQPRYFCKTCRRYWTEGGSLRNIPVGGGSRKNKRSSSSASSSSTISSSATNNSNSSSSSITTSKKLPDLATNHQNPNNKIQLQQGQDLNLSFPSQSFKSISELVQLPTNIETNNKTHLSSSTTANNNTQLSALELLTGISSRGLNSFMPMSVPDPNSVYSTSGFNPMQDFKPTLNFSLDGLGVGGSGFGSSLHTVHQESSTTSGRLLFPFDHHQDLKQVSTTNTTSDMEQNREHNNGDSTTGYWTGMLGGGTW